MRENLEQALRALLDELASRALAAGDGFLEDAWPMFWRSPVPAGRCAGR